MISKFPEQCQKLKKSPVGIIRSMITSGQYQDDLGLLWTYLAEFFIRQGQFGVARDIFEEAIDIESLGVNTVRDLAIVFNSYIRFERQIIQEQDQSADMKDKVDSESLEFSQFRLDDLLERRAFLISDVLLQQNPNDVNEWIHRIQLCDRIKDENKDMVKEQTFVKAI